MHQALVPVLNYVPGNFSNYILESEVKNILAGCDGL